MFVSATGSESQPTIILVFDLDKQLEVETMNTTASLIEKLLLRSRFPSFLANIVFHINTAHCLITRSISNP